MDFLKKYYIYFTIIFVFIIYLLTLAPSVMQIDSGELAAVQATLGIAHPTGYPLFTILGYFFLELPLPFSKILQANLFSALCCALALFFFMKSAALLLNLEPAGIHSNVKEKKKKSKPEIKKAVPALTEWDKIAVIIISSFFIAFNATFWQLSVSIEVYSLQALLFALIIFFAVRLYSSEKPALKDFLYLSALTAFGFTNHMTTLLLVPGLLYLFFAKLGFTKETVKKGLLMLSVFFGIVITVYSYLLIRSSQNPLLNWGNPYNIENFIRHVSGKQYQVWMFSSIEAAKAQLGNYISGLPIVFAYIPLLFSAAGLVSLFKLDKRLFAFFIISYLFSVLYTINYSIHDIESYFLLSYMILSVFALYGLAKILILVKSRFKNACLSYAALTVPAVFMFFLNYSKADSSGIYIYEDYTKTILNSVPENSIIFSYQWDYFIASSYYFSKVENFRKDVTVIDKELLRRSWYYKQLENNSPDVVKNIKPEINSFLDALKPFEQDKTYNPETLEYFYQAIMTKLISENIKSRNYFIGPELVDGEMKSGQFKLPQGCSLVPYGLLFKVVKGTGYVPGPPLDFRIRIPEELNNYTTFIYNQLGIMLTRRALYEIQFEKTEEAKKIANKMKSELPGYPIQESILQDITDVNKSGRSIQ